MVATLSLRRYGCANALFIYSLRSYRIIGAFLAVFCIVY